MTHTPGPWFNDGTDIMAEDNFCVATVHRPRMDDEGTYMSNGRANANARLIAAAPALLEALKLLLFQGGENYACYCNDPDYQFNSGRDKCDNCIAASAIAKAEGRDE